MDMIRSARYFDRQPFDALNDGFWTAPAFNGQLKISDKFTSMWNRGTRKRMVFVTPEVEQLVTPVIRVSGSSDVYMVGTPQRDFYQNKHYRTTYNVQHIAGVAVVARRAPTGPSNNPGFAVSTTVSNTYADFELRSVDEDQDRKINNYGSYFVFLPSDIVLQRRDSITVNGRTFYVLEHYPDSGLVCARATIKADDRVNVVYTSIGTPVYNDLTSDVTSSDTAYNVTGRVVPYEQSDVNNTMIVDGKLRFMILKTWIGVVPKLNDRLTFGGIAYTVFNISQDSLGDEWHIEAKV